MHFIILKLNPIAVSSHIFLFPTTGSLVRAKIAYDLGNNLKVYHGQWYLFRTHVWCDKGKVSQFHCHFIILLLDE